MLRMKLFLSEKPWAKWLAVFFLFLFLFGLLNVRYNAANTALSPIDEYNYVDAVDKASRGIVSHEGATVDQVAQEASACRGFGIMKGKGTPEGVCGGNNSLEDFPWDGHSTAGIHSPVYYFVTAWIAKPIEWLVPSYDLVDAARLTGAFWLAAGATVLCALVSREAGRLSVGIALPLFVCSLPAFRTTTAYITPDALNLLAGASITLAAMRYVRKEWSVWPFLLLSGIFTLVKMQNAFIAAAMWLFLLWYKIGPRRQSSANLEGGEEIPDTVALPIGSHKLSFRRHPSWLALSALPVVVAAIAVGWNLIRTALSVEANKPPQVDRVADLSLNGLIDSFGDGILIMFRGFFIEQGMSPFVTIALFVSVGALASVAWFRQGDDVLKRRFAEAGIGSLFLVGPGIYLCFGLLFGSWVPVQTRYVQVLIPIYAVAGAWVTERKSVRVGLWVLAVSAYAFALLLGRGY